jgi:two-component system CheB/CheR fusion protein
VFVDQQLRILRFTPTVASIINLIPGDVRRPIGHIVSNLVGYDRLVADAQEVLDTLVPKELEVQTVAAKWYILRMLPYRTLEDVIEGVVMTFVDITEAKRARTALEKVRAGHPIGPLGDDLGDALVVHDLQGHILALNTAAEKLYGWTAAEAMRMDIRSLVPEDERDGSLERALGLASAHILKPSNARRLTKSGTVIDVSITATTLRREDGTTYGIATLERETQH